MANILIFEDDQILAESWEEILSTQGHQVELTTNLDTAMSKICEGYIDIALVDIFMQENHQSSSRGGFVLISRINMLTLERRPWLVAVSGRLYDSSLSVLEVAQKLGADEYLKKPIDLQELVTVIDRVVQAQANKGYDNDS